MRNGGYLFLHQPQSPHGDSEISYATVAVQRIPCSCERIDGPVDGLDTVGEPDEGTKYALSSLVGGGRKVGRRETLQC